MTFIECISNNKGINNQTDINNISYLLMSIEYVLRLQNIFLLLLTSVLFFNMCFTHKRPILLFTPAPVK